MTRRRALALLAGMAASVVRADALQGAFLALPISPAQVGMGDAGTGVGDALAGWSNPAELTLLSTRFVVQAGGGQFYGGEVPLVATAAAWRGERWALGAALSSISLSYPEVDALGEETTNRIAHDGRGFGGMVAYSWGAFGVGISFKSVQETLLTSTTGASTADLGLVAGTGGLVASCAVQKMLTGIELHGGMRYRYAPWHAAAGFGYRYVSASGLGEAGIGAEWWPAAIIGVRAGAAGLGGAMRPAFGFAANWQFLQLQYAAALHPLGVVHSASLGAAFGGATAAHQKDPGRRGEPAAAGDSTPPAGATPGQLAAPPPVSEPSADELYAQGSQDYAAGNYDDAWRKAAAAVTKDSGHWMSWWLIGNCQLAKGDPAGARKTYQVSLNLHPDNPALQAWMLQAGP